MTEPADDPNLHVFEYLKGTDSDGDLWIVVKRNGERFQDIGPFDTEEELLRASSDLQEMMRGHGATDIPRHSN